MIIINNIKLSLDADLNDVYSIVASKLKISKQDIISAELYRKSVDARDKRDVHFCVSIIARLKNEALVLKRNKNAAGFKPAAFFVGSIITESGGRCWPYLLLSAR